MTRKRGEVLVSQGYVTRKGFPLFVLREPRGERKREVMGSRSDLETDHAAVRCGELPASDNKSLLLGVTLTPVSLFS